MNLFGRIVLLLLMSFLMKDTYCQKVNGEIFIPLNNRSEIWLKPKIDTLENAKEYEFKIRVSSEYKISQFLFEKGLATQNDSVLVIKPNSTKYGSIDTCILRVIVMSTSGSRIMLFQKMFLVNVPERMFPVITNPKVNLIKLNDKLMLERNRPYPKNIFTEKQPFISMYNNELEMKPIAVKSVTIALYEKEGKNYVSEGDTISSEAIRELKKLKTLTPFLIK